MNLRDHETLLARALDWIARLPLLGERELADLLGVHEQDARAARHELERRGWVDWIVPGEPGLDQRRFAYLREPAVSAFAIATGVPPERLARCAPVRRRDVLVRVACAGITAGVNRFLSRVAAHAERGGIGELADARSLPLAGQASERWWPAGVDGYGCLRSQGAWAPCFVAWDRAAAPDAHRRVRAARWAATRASRAWGTAGLPAILVVAAGEHELGVWEDALCRHDGELAGAVLLATAHDVLRRDLESPMWHAPGGRRVVTLTAALRWGEQPPPESPHVPSDTVLPSLPRSGETLRSWAPRAAARGGHPSRERTAALAIATDVLEKRLLDWVAYHPLLTAPELAVLVRESEAAVDRRLEWLARCRALRAVADPQDADARQCYLLNGRGLRLLAARAGVPQARYAGRGGVTVPADGASGPALWHPEHARGVNRTFVRLARDAQRAGGRLAEWRSEAASTRRFVQDGRTWFIRPDGSGVLAVHGRRVPFLLEYDRGTLDAGDFTGKFDGYRRYFAEEVWRLDFETEPVLLFVCSDDRAERRVAVAVGREASELPLVVTAEWRDTDARAVPVLLLESASSTVLSGSRRPAFSGRGSDNANTPIRPV